MGQSEEDCLKSETRRFLNFFERIKVEFVDCEDLYPPVDWVKAKSATGSVYDCFELTRMISKD